MKQLSIWKKIRKFSLIGFSFCLLANAEAAQIENASSAATQEEKQASTDPQIAKTETAAKDENSEKSDATTVAKQSQASEPSQDKQDQQTANDPKASSELQTKLDKIRSMEANFKQSIYGAHSRAKPEVTYGFLVISKPNKFKWAILQGQRGKTISQEIISNGKKLWNYDVDLEQVTVGKLNLHQEHTPAALLSGKASELSDIYNIISGKNNEYQLLAKDIKQSIMKVDLKFAGENPEEMRLYDRANQIIEIKFTDIKTNHAIPDKDFEFKQPKGVKEVAAQ